MIVMGLFYLYAAHKFKSKMAGVFSDIKHRNFQWRVGKVTNKERFQHTHRSNGSRHTRTSYSIWVDDEKCIAFDDSDYEQAGVNDIYFVLYVRRYAYAIRLRNI